MHKSERGGREGERERSEGEERGGKEGGKRDRGEEQRRKKERGTGAVKEREGGRI